MSQESMVAFFKKATQNGEDIKDLYSQIKEIQLNIIKKLAKEKEEEEARRGTQKTASSAAIINITNNKSL